MPEGPLLAAPTVEALLAACDARLLAGGGTLLGREALGLIVAAMTLPNHFTRLEEGSVVVTPGDRAVNLVGDLAAHHSTAFPAL